jgi:hypothetical protein
MPCSSPSGTYATAASTDQAVYVTGTYRSMYGWRGFQKERQFFNVGGLSRGLWAMVCESSQLVNSAVIAGEKQASVVRTMSAPRMRERRASPSAAGKTVAPSPCLARSGMRPTESLGTFLGMGRDHIRVARLPAKPAAPRLGHSTCHGKTHRA